MNADRKLCVVCSRIYRSDETTCPDDGSPLVMEAAGGDRGSRLGHVVGNYRLLRVLGEGGVGTVYEAEHVRLGRKMAVKLLHPDVVNRELVVRFFNEARAVNSIHHPNIIDVEDFVTAPTGEHYMVMELLIGEDLRTVISRDRRLAPERVASIGAQVASALAAVHEVGIIHRDLKPDNVFLIRRDGNEIAKLLDFGIAKFTDDTEGVTRAGMTMGTPSYMAPEQILQGQEIGLSSDLYALGMVMYESLTGAPAFGGATNAAIMRAQCVDPVVPPSLRRKEPLPPVLEAAVMKCLEKDTAHRFASAQQLVEALASDRPVRRSRQLERKVARAHSRRRIVYLMPALAMAAAAAVLHFWLDILAVVAPGADHGTTAAAAATPGLQPAAALAAPPAPVAPAAGVERAEPPSTVPAEMAIDLQSVPPGAEVFLGVARIALGRAPVVATIPMANEPVTLVARFPGGVEVTETIVPDRTSAAIVFVEPAPPDESPPASPTRPAARPGRAVAPRAVAPRAVAPPRGEPRPGEPRPRDSTIDREATLDPFK